MNITRNIAAEFEFVSNITYERPFYDMQLDVEFTSETGIKLTVPAFWDGGNIFKARFALPEQGGWRYKTVCCHGSDGANESLHQCGEITVLDYEGELDIYKRGHVKTESGTRYFMYGDGSPFFYLGDTHWNMPAEEYDSAGEHARGIETASHFQYIIDKRVQQCFTVYQSEPISAKYDLRKGFTEEVLAGFRDLDRRFAYIAQKGLVHANAMLVFANELALYLSDYPDSYLELLCRYWVARYSAYPVLWTMAQEVDCDFYFYRGDQKIWDAKTNPWKKVAEWTHNYDPYKRPLTAHQMCATVDNPIGVCCSTSSFRELKGHGWYGVQWSPSLNNKPDFRLARDYWEHGQGKVTVNYEGRYDYLWTKHFGARVQGWTAYLNGMYGYGYGAADIWLYKSNYDMDTTSNDGVEEIAPADKQTTWGESVEFETALQLGNMRVFFEKFAWQRLVPRFDDAAWCGIASAYYSLATIDNELYVAYFYNKSSETGALRGLRGSYSKHWYNPRANEYSTEEIIDCDGEYIIENKPDIDDWVLILKKINHTDIRCDRHTGHSQY